MQKSVTKELTKALAFCLEHCKARTSTKLLAQNATVFVDLCYLSDAIVTLLIYNKYRIRIVARKQNSKFHYVTSFILYRLKFKKYKIVYVYFAKICITITFKTVGMK